MKEKLFVLFFLYGLCLTGYSQFEKNYYPIEDDRTFPEEFTTDYVRQMQVAIANEKELTNEAAIALYSNVYATKKSFLTDGRLYYDDVLTGYVRKVSDEILKNSPELQAQIKVYVVRNSSSNAIAMPDGTVLINVGLLARLENEAQLAFILGHEIAHFEKRHTVKDILKINAVETQEKKTSYEVTNFRKLRYSRDAEFEADARGVQFVTASGYDASESIKALKIIDDTLYKYPTLIDYLISTLSSENIKIDSTFFRKGTNEKDGSSKSNIVFGSSSEDLYTTHPDIYKRYTALEEVLKLIEYSNEDKHNNLFLTEQQLSEIQQKSFFEMIENLYRQTDYNVSLYLGLGIQPVYPENVYLKKMIVKNLYWLSYYKEMNNVSKTINNHVIQKTPSFTSLNIFLLNVSHNDLKKINFEYAKKQLELLKHDDEFFLYYAMISELYLGKESAALLYQQHNIKFPDSKYYLYANRKTLK
jgi:hypothetical protein